MDHPPASPQVTLRIPGNWSHPKELLKRLPTGYHLGPETMRLPDGTEIEFNPVPPDGQFARIFQTACRQPPTDEELAVVRGYQVNVCLTGLGGSLAAAKTMMEAASAIVRAGAAGVFIDNSAMAHGGQDWLSMTEEGSSDSISFAFVSIIRGDREAYTIGMQVLGFPELLVTSQDVYEHGESIIEIIRYIAGSDRPIDVGHIFADLRGPSFQIVAKGNDRFEADSVMHNPYGQWKVVPMKDLAEGN